MEPSGDVTASGENVMESGGTKGMLLWVLVVLVPEGTTAEHDDTVGLVLGSLRAALTMSPQGLLLLVFVV